MCRETLNVNMFLDNQCLTPVAMHVIDGVGMSVGKLKV